MKKLLFLVALILLASSGLAEHSGKYAPVNGLKLYYELHGNSNDKNPPVVLLHGGVGAIEMFGPILETLAKDRRVIGVDLQAHGRTADIDRPLRYELMADDIAGLINFLGIKRADVMGYSVGGGVALRTAIQHPEVVRRLVVLSAPCKREGWYPEILLGMAQMGPQSAEPMKQTPMYQLYSKVAPKVEDWPMLLTKLGDLLRREYDWSKEVAAIKAPVLLIAGDADSVRTAHSVEFFELLGGGKKDAGWDGSGRPTSQLAILPGLTHYTIFSSPALTATVIPFLDKPLTERVKPQE
jgi:pimeloyl-ACP methyl ester carboxylesterase